VLTLSETLVRKKQIYFYLYTNYCLLSDFFYLLPNYYLLTTRYCPIYYLLTTNFLATSYCPTIYSPTINDETHSRKISCS